MAQFNYHSQCLLLHRKAIKWVFWSSARLSPLSSSASKALRNANVSALVNWMKIAPPSNGPTVPIDRHQLHFSFYFYLSRLQTSLFSIDMHTTQPHTHLHHCTYQSTFLIFLLCSSNYTLKFDLHLHLQTPFAQLAHHSFCCGSTSLDDLRYMALAHWSPLNASHQRWSAS